MCEIHHWAVSSSYPKKLTVVMGVLIAHVSMAQSCDVEICRDLFHFNAAVYPTGWSVFDFIVCRPICRVQLLYPPLLLAREEFAYPGQGLSLIGSAAFGRVDHLMSGGIGWRAQSVG